MSKNPWLLYGGRGKVGNIVLQRNKGVTVMREKVDPTNVRSMSQQKQRSKFGYLAKFYSKGVQNLFMFAFESKRSNESDYNAFMRNNVQSSLYASQTMLMNPITPWFGEWLMSEGSLESLDRDITLNGGIASMLLNSEDVNATVASVSEAILSEHPTLANGDILTFVSIADVNEGASVNATLAECLDKSSLVDGVGGSLWNIKQFKINTADPSNLSFVGFGLDASVFYPVVPEFADTSDVVCGCCVIASRNTDKGVKVSTSRLKLSTQLRNSINKIATSADWAEFCAKSMGGTEDALLKGSAINAGRKEFSIVGGPITYSGSGRSEAPDYVSNGFNVYDLTIEYNGSVMSDVRVAPSVDSIAGSDSPIYILYVGNAFNNYDTGVLITCDENGNLMKPGDKPCIVQVKKGDAGTYNLVLRR